MTKKAKDCPPWTKRKLNKYREQKRIELEKERAAAKLLAKELKTSGAGVDRVLEGCNG